MASSKGVAVGCLWVLHGGSEGRIRPSCSALKPSHIQTPSRQCPPHPLPWLGTSTHAAPISHQHPSPALWSTPSKEGESSKDASTSESTGTLAFSTLESTIHREVGLKVSFR